MDNDDFLDEDVGRLSPQKLQVLEDCTAAIQALFHRALEQKGPSAFQEFLDFARRFTNLSVYNAMLVHVQRQGALAVATKRKWGTLGRLVLPDAVPIVILQPYGPVLFVYEWGDTDGPAVHGSDQIPIGALGKPRRLTYDRMMYTASNYGIAVEETDQYGFGLGGSAAAAYEFPEAFYGPGQPEVKHGIPRRWRIKVNSRVDLPSRFAVLAHELGHIYCGHLGGGPNAPWPARRPESLDARELEAEAVAWMVCQRNGMTTRSEEYLRGYVRPDTLDQVDMYAIYVAANRVEQ